MGVAAARKRGHGYYLRTPVTEEVSAFYAATHPQGRAAGAQTVHEQHPVQANPQPQPDTLPNGSGQGLPVQQFIEDQVPGQQGAIMQPPVQNQQVIQNQFANGQIMQEYIELPIEQPVQTQGDGKFHDSDGIIDYQDFNPLDATAPSTPSLESLPAPSQTNQILDSASIQQINERGQLSKLPSRSTLREYLGLPAQQAASSSAQQQAAVQLQATNPFAVGTTQAAPVAHKPVVEFTNPDNTVMQSLPTAQASSPFDDFPDALLPGN